MWKKQPEVKSSYPSAPGGIDTPSYTPPSEPSGGMFVSSPGPVMPSSATTVPPEAALLTRGISIKGDLTGKGEIFIDGEIVGSIRLGDSRVTIGPNGRIKAGIEARDIAVRGQVDGNLRGQGQILLGSTSRVVGDLEAVRVVIEDGARFKGHVEMGRPPEMRGERDLSKEAPKRPVSQAPTPATTPASGSHSAPTAAHTPASAPAPKPATSPAAAPNATPGSTPPEPPRGTH